METKYFATTSDGTGLCYDDEITELPCIELIGKVKITNPVSAVGEFAILTQNPDGIISSIPLSTLSSEDADSDPLNEIQTLSISGNEISLSQGGGSVTILAGMDNLGSHIATQAVDMNAHGIINLSYPINGNDATTKAYVDAISINDADADPTNELQQIEISAMNDTIRISGSNDDFWILPGVSAANWAVDGSGNKYRIAKIGTQTWLRSNLRTTKYNDGTPIPNVTANASWAAWTGTCILLV
ncbi:MAG: hypothetical protein IPL23_21550 [Saprospiraceae bacterium]|nr:hypothetical protein [Saprospiraceae bacterium]